MELIKQVDWEPGNKKENGAFVYACQFSKYGDPSNESILAGASGLNEVRIFDATKDYTPHGWVEGFEKGIYTVDFGNFTNKFGFAGGDGKIVVLSLSS